jgi:hypothetical protein
LVLTDFGVVSVTPVLMVKLAIVAPPCETGGDVGKTPGRDATREWDRATEHTFGVFCNSDVTAC